MPLSVRIISNDPEQRDVLCHFLRSEGHEPSCNVMSEEPDCVLHHSSRQERSKSRTDLIIIEISPPEADAIALLSSLQRSPETKNIPIIVISDFPELEYEIGPHFDFIAKPLDLGRLRENLELLVLGRRRKNGTATAGKSLNSYEHQLFHDYLIKHSGLHFDKRNIKMLERALRIRMDALHIPSCLDYYEFLSQRGETRQELQKLLRLLTVGETFFFRYHSHYDLLAKLILQSALKNPEKRSLRIWSAGCSTGEEPYSIAMTVMDTLPDWRKRDISIIATDINDRSLHRAKDGVYSSWKLRVTPQQQMERYFKKIGESYVINNEVKSLVSLSYGNLQGENSYPDGPFDFIFCRNVLIYFTTATIKRVIEQFSGHLAPGGHLFLGHSETLSGISSGFERKILESSFYYVKKGVTATGESPGNRPPATPARISTLSLPGSAALPAQPKITPLELFTKGLELYHREQLNDADDCFAGTVALRPDHTGAILGQGQIRMARGEYQAAFDCFDKALEINDLLPEGYFLRGVLLEMIDRETEALEEYRKAILLKIDFIMPHYHLGRLAHRTGDPKISLREFRNCIRLLEKSRDESVIPFSGGLSREIFLERVRNEMHEQESVVLTAGGGI